MNPRALLDEPGAPFVDPIGADDSPYSAKVESADAVGGDLRTRSLCAVKDILEELVFQVLGIFLRKSVLRLAAAGHSCNKASPISTVPSSIYR